MAFFLAYKVHYTVKIHRLERDRQENQDKCRDIVHFSGQFFFSDLSQFVFKCVDRIEHTSYSDDPKTLSPEDISF